MIPAGRVTTSNMATFGLRLRLVRTALELTQRDLAERVGANVVTLSKLEADRTSPRPATIERLARGLKVHADVLLNDRSCAELLAGRLGVSLGPVSEDVEAVAKIVEGLKTLMRKA